VAVGTRYVASEESTSFDSYKEALVAAGADDTVLTGVFDVGWPDAAHRVLRNSTYRAWEAAGCPAPGARPGEGDVVGTYRGDPIPRYSVESPGPGVESDDPEALCLYAGQGVELIDGVLPAARIVEQLA
jgi:NAD(P)H-dependent flavin oxidoreductase YrpB (nitropropane dioxygenase family)